MYLTSALHGTHIFFSELKSNIITYKQMLFREIIDKQKIHKKDLKNKTPRDGITIVIENQKIREALDGTGFVHPNRKSQYLALFNNVLSKYKLPNSNININLSDHPMDGYFNFCRIKDNNKQFLLPNHRFTKDDIIRNTQNFDEVVKYIRSKLVPYVSRKSKFYTNCIPHNSKTPYLKYTIENPTICDAYVYGGSVHKFFSLDPVFINRLTEMGMVGIKPVPFETHNNYKYVIYNDGNTLSDRMRLLLCTDAVIVRKKKQF
jgi:hypothetical protein